MWGFQSFGKGIIIIYNTSNITYWSPAHVFKQLLLLILHYFLYFFANISIVWLIWCFSGLL